MNNVLKHVKKNADLFRSTKLSIEVSHYVWKNFVDNFSTKFDKSENLNQKRQPVPHDNHQGTHAQNNLRRYIAEMNFLERHCELNKK